MSQKELQRGQTLREQSRALWEEVFPEDGAAFLDAYYAGKGSRNEIAVSMDGQDRLASMIHWNPVEVSFYGTRCSVDFLVAVATRADCRRQGRMASLMRDGLNKRAKAGMPFVFLTPAEEYYYTPFEFVSVGSCMSIVLSQKEQICSKRIRRIEPSEYRFVADWCNERLQKRYSLYALRSEAYLKTLERELCSEGGHIMGIFEKETLCGSFLYTTEGGLELRELICDKDVETELVSCMAAWADEKCAQEAESSHTFPSETTDQTRETREQCARETALVGCSKDLPGCLEQSKTMVRIVSLTKCLSCLPRERCSGSWMHVQDALLTENRGYFCVIWEKDAPKVLVRDTPPETEPCAEWSIGELTKLLFNSLFLNEIV